MTSDSPYAPPESALTNVDESKIFRKGKYVIYNSDDGWPSRCFKCNSETDFKKEVKLTYVNPWIYLTLLITPLITIILGLIFQKKFRLQLPICELHAKKWKRFLIFQWSMLALTITGFFIGILTEMKFFLGISGSLLLLLIVLAVFGRQVYIVKYKKQKLWVKGTGAEYRDSLPEFTQ